jgi:hypothetical protein
VAIAEVVCVPSSGLKEADIDPVLEMIADSKVHFARVTSPPPLA